MTEDDKAINMVLGWCREATPNKTEQAEKFALCLEESPRLRAAVARQIIARQVPLVGEVT